MAAYKPATPFATPIMLLIPSISTSYGVETKSFPEISSGKLFFGTFRTFGGTERDVNGMYAVEDTAVIETWYDPEITAACRIGLPVNNTVYEIVGTPENIEMRNQYLRFKVKRVTGGA